MTADRRGFFRAMGTGAAGVAIGTTRLAPLSAAPRLPAAKEEDGPVLLVGDEIAVAETQHGKVRGYVLRGIHYFLGIPYGADTSGANRFMPPQKPKPWTERLPGALVGQHGAAEHGEPVREHVRLVPRPLELRRRQRGLPAAERVHAGARRTGRSGRCCSGSTAAASRTATPSSTTATTARTSRASGDVVFVSINHRLGPLGYCNLAGVGGDEVRRVRQRRHARHRRRARVGARQHRELRRRPRQRDDHGAVGRRREGLHAHRDAVGEGAVPQGRRAERRLAADRARRSTPRSSAPRCSKEAGLAPGRDRQAAADAVEGVLRASPRKAQQKLRRRPGRGGGHAARLQPGRRRQRPAAAPVRARGRRRRPPACR